MKMAGELYYQVTVKAGFTTYDLSDDLTSFTLDEEEGKPDALTLRLADPYRVLSHALQEGMEVEVDLGTTDDHALIFSGDIHRTQADFPEGGVPTLSVQAYDRAMRMGLRERNRTWSGAGLDLSDIVAQVAAPHGFGTVDVQLAGNPTFEENGIRQRDETDLAFLLRLARDWACQMYAKPEGNHTLRFVSQHHVMTERELVTLHYGRCGADGHLLSLEAHSDITEVVRPRVFAGIDYDTGERVDPATAEPREVADTEDEFMDENLAEFRSREPERAAALTLLLSSAAGSRSDMVERLRRPHREPTHSFITREHRDARKRNDYSTRLLGMRASGTTHGNIRIHAQAAVRLSDVGGRLSGTWFLSRVRHQVDGQGYRTDFDCRR
ncbi:MAG: phage late control D family protein [Gemmatimonadales bacterium]|nr:MAG: phage late control D family protein [Gemmatimonadales bacterium]